MPFIFNKNNDSSSNYINEVKKVSDIPILTKIKPNLSSTNFFQSAAVNNNVNRNFIEQFVDLSCIPTEATLTLEPILPESTTEIQFRLTSNMFYKDNGVTTYENYSQTITFPIIQVIDPILIISLIAGESFVLLIFILIYMSKRRIRY